MKTPMNERFHQDIWTYVPVWWMDLWWMPLKSRNVLWSLSLRRIYYDREDGSEENFDQACIKILFNEWTKYDLDEVHMKVEEWSIWSLLEKLKYCHDYPNELSYLSIKILREWKQEKNLRYNFKTRLSCFWKARENKYKISKHYNEPLETDTFKPS
jgi:hypothetical protein